MANTLDARGLACPLPVIKTRDALAAIQTGELTVLLDNTTARDNVLRFAQNHGCAAEVVRESAEAIEIRVVKSGPSPSAAKDDAFCIPDGGTILVLASSTVGHGDDTLGTVLTKAFLHTVLHADERPSLIVLMNSGVKLAAEGSECLGKLRELEQSGVRILVCGVCVDFFSLKGKTLAGTISNAYSIWEEFAKARKVISI
jgi:selenium metabolism protein YedF